MVNCLVSLIPSASHKPSRTSTLVFVAPSPEQPVVHHSKQSLRSQEPAKMHFTPIIALAGLAAAAPQGIVYRRATNDTVSAGLKYSRSTQIVNDTAPADIKLSRSTLNGNYTAPADTKLSRSTLNGNYTAPAGVKLVSRSAQNFNTTYPPGLSVTPSS